MRRILVLVGLSTLLLATAVGVAVAVTKQCTDIPCKGSPNDDQLLERRGNEVRDRILGLDGEDVIEASTYGRDRDVVEGGRKDDRLSTNDGDGRDTVRGDRGADICFVDPGDVSSSCQRRGDTDPASVP